MHTPKRVIVALVMGAILTGTVAAQSMSFSYRQAGNLVGAVAGGTGPNYSWGVNLNPVMEDNGRDSYLVTWTVQTWTATPPTPYAPYPQGSWFGIVIGVAPASEFHVSPSGELAIDLSLAKLSQVHVAFVNDCTSMANPCAPGDPKAFAVNGAFTPCQAGSACSTFSRNGTDQQRNVNPGLNIVTNTFTGSQAGGDADFTGTVGPLTIQPGSAAIRYMTVRKGMLRYDQVPLE